MRSRVWINWLLLLVKFAAVLASANGDSQNGTVVGGEVENSIESPKQVVPPSLNETTSATSEAIATEAPLTTTSSGAEQPMLKVTAGTTSTIPVTTTTASITTTTTVGVTGGNSDPSMGLDGVAAGDNKTPNCSHFPLSPQQPVYDKNSHIKKCCPFGEIFAPLGSGHFRCVPGERKLDVETIYAVFYGDSECIEDKENELHFNYEPNDSCLGNNLTFQYSKEQGDELFVIQNGSLLVLEPGGFMSVFDWYCLEVDTGSRLLAKACDEVPPIVLRSTAALIYAGMVVATATLLFTCLVHALVPRLNDTFGYLLAGHSASFLLGLIMMTLAVCGDRCIDGNDVVPLQIFAQIFLVSAVFIFLLMNVHNYAYGAYYLPNGLEFDTSNKRDMFISLGVLYLITIIPLFLPWKHSLIFHLVLYIYYLATAVVLYLSHRAIRTLANSKFVRFTASQNHPELTYMEAVNAQPRINGDRLKDVRSLNRLCTIEAIFSLVCWICFSSLQRNIDSQHDIFRIGAAYAVIFQGLLIGVLFVGGRKKWTIIRECWNYSGSIDLRALEMEREMLTLDRKAPPL
ncbi:uncharacterized protein LOC128734398 [Sabethes cyaneus]|uniref:uncharacterized protein LOC128734398 n=1 Tax=Sabethes cyaneus TaxID=53552 RepID=UPI00237D47CF|nr:uncharacterized protein LOC128734398 [Sabethes cyaneus]XP_053684562.1 uncharacterized protein LOC128734398 [Sabethes cyaneus]XP_053684563.1 uncharacterized protein LOC128734398 [Sabethes cyaneus]XP_053684564.1 uncharacterized protein LOC128734398 [Sabethes cyaneus]XP_053684565.1 uncharacterized protein LOC128734398 [Sabethes cyaneus]XP_053684566.1 uncharacterized protein LOC128734398 [Sabethes cyaneus]XP_053684567.1 uncharacterized protein LOC128734398 [Sabethes cyaneus]